MSALEIIHHSFADKFGEAVGIDRIGTRALANGHLLRLTVDRAARRKYDRADAGAHHRVQQNPRAVYVHIIVPSGLRDRLSDVGESRKMHDRINPMRLE